MMMTQGCTEAFEAWLDGYWPLWRQHVGNIKYVGLKRAFEAGWTARRRRPTG